MEIVSKRSSGHVGGSFGNPAQNILLDVCFFLMEFGK